LRIDLLSVTYLGGGLAIGSVSRIIPVSNPQNMHSSEKCLIRISSRPPLQLIMQPLVVEDLAEAVLLYQLDARGIYAYRVALYWKHFDSNQLWNRF